jgi:glycosyltransferase involved in cell wall biosynthesis
MASLPLLRSGDIVMARGPDSLGFLGGVLARLKGLPRFAKYADQWQSFHEEPRGYRLQKAFYRGSWFGGPVQIYGSADPRRPHLVPFFTSSFTESEWTEAGDQIAMRSDPPPWRILFCGRFVHAKGIDLLLRAFKRFLDAGIPGELNLVGDGEEMAASVNLTRALGIQEHVVFHGWLGREALLKQYGRAHVFVHSSRKEGFGKVIIEAMSFALPVIATDVGVSRFLIHPPECGTLAKPEDEQDLAEHLLKMAGAPEEARRMGVAARARVTQFLFEKLEQQYREFLSTQHELSIN